MNCSQLRRRYTSLRIADAARQGRLAASLAQHGQQTPVVVVRDQDAVAGEYVLIDGYLRVSALESLGRDVVAAVVWDVPEPRALVLSHRLDNTQVRSPLEEGWLLHELQTSYQYSLGDLAVLLDRSRSWVCRRLSLVQNLPSSAQTAVRRGQLPAYAAQKYLVPLARANSNHCERLVAGLGKDRVTVRQMEALYIGWRGSDKQARERIVDKPLLYLKVREQTEVAAVGREAERTPLFEDLGVLVGVSMRAERRIDSGALDNIPKSDRDRVRRRWTQTEHAFSALRARMEEDRDRPGHTHSDSTTS